MWRQVSADGDSGAGVRGRSCRRRRDVGERVQGRGRLETSEPPTRSQRVPWAANSPRSLWVAGAEALMACHCLCFPLPGGRH